MKRSSACYRQKAKKSRFVHTSPTKPSLTKASKPIRGTREFVLTGAEEHKLPLEYVESCIVVVHAIRDQTSRGTLNGRWDDGRLTGPAILATFRTPEGFTVIKSELVDRISIQNPHLYRQHAEKIVNTIFSEITAAMARGDRVELRGFGVFFVRVREGRTGRNPRTGALVSVGSKAVPFFRSGKGMKSLLNSQADGG